MTTSFSVSVFQIPFRSFFARFTCSDDDLFAHISSVCSKKCNGHSVSTLSKEAKIELAKELHFDFRTACEIIGWAKQPSYAHFTLENEVEMCKRACFAQQSP